MCVFVCVSVHVCVYTNQQHFYVTKGEKWSLHAPQ